MKNFIVIESGLEGCDYSIGCGTKVSEIKANSLEDAAKQYEAQLIENNGGLGSFSEDAIRPHSVEILEVVGGMQVNMTSLRKRVDLAYQDAKDAMEIKRLQARLAELHNRANV